MGKLRLATDGCTGISHVLCTGKLSPRCEIFQEELSSPYAHTNCRVDEFPTTNVIYGLSRKKSIRSTERLWMPLMDNGKSVMKILLNFFGWLLIAKCTSVGLHSATLGKSLWSYCLCYRYHKDYTVVNVNKRDGMKWTVSDIFVHTVCRVLCYIECLIKYHAPSCAFS